jgi:hypothetical protein
MTGKIWETDLGFVVAILTNLNLAIFNGNFRRKFLAQNNNLIFYYIPVAKTTSSDLMSTNGTLDRWHCNFLGKIFEICRPKETNKIRSFFDYLIKSLLKD